MGNEKVDNPILELGMTFNHRVSHCPEDMGVISDEALGRYREILSVAHDDMGFMHALMASDDAEVRVLGALMARHAVGMDCVRENPTAMVAAKAGLVAFDRAASAPLDVAA